MKTKITITLFIAACFLFITTANAQWNATGDALSGGSSSTPNEWLGSTNLYDLIIKANGVEGLRITGLNVGIGGIVSPLANLHVIQKTATAIGASKGFIYTGIHNTKQTASTEIPSATFTTVGREWSAGTLALQREFLITQPTYSFASTSTLTDAATLGIAGAPIKSTNADITNTHGILVEAGAVSTATNSYGLTVNAQTGATNNYAAQFLGGNVGIGTTTPLTRLEVLPSTTNSSIKTGSLELQSYTVNDSWYGENLYYNAGWNYRSASSKYGTALYFEPGGDFRIITAPQGTGAATISTKFTVENTGNVGIGTTNPGYQLELSTNSAGKPTGGSWTNSSDLRLKKDISAFTDGLEVIKQIHPVNFRFNGKGGIVDTNEFAVSVIAQQIQPIAPYTVGTYQAKLNINDTGTTELLNFNTSALLFVAINAIKQLDSVNTALAAKDSIKTAKIQTLETKDSILTVKSQSHDSIIASLQNQLNQLASLISDCCNNHGNGNGNGNGHGNLSTSEPGDYKSLTTNAISVELSNKNIVVLNQNVPNPFAEQTTISYFLPDNVIRAQIIFLEQSGKLIKTVDLTEKGKGVLNVFANDLSSGLYTYSLIVDGQTIETKKMIKQ